jgi:hypothetical protein
VCVCNFSGVLDASQLLEAGIWVLKSNVDVDVLKIQMTTRTDSMLKEESHRLLNPLEGVGPCFKYKP